MFESLSEKIQGVFSRLIRGQAKLTEENINEALREVRRALLEADVNLSVVKAFIGRVKEQALGEAVLSGLNPGQTFIKLVHDELVNVMGGERAALAKAPTGVTVVLMAGLQGMGKTTTAGKLALMLKRQGMRPLLAAADIYRPAAIKQLETLAKQIDVPIHAPGVIDPVEIGRQALQRAQDESFNYLLVDTAGRLHIDGDMMEEITRLKSALQPHEVLLVVDAMIGQDAVQMASAFHDTLNITGVVLTKLDGDTRGGAALSIRQVTGCPIKFMGTSEKLDGLEAFHPERIATRILGMGDVLTLIEKAQEAISLEEAKALEEKMRKAEFTLEDFAHQLQQMKKIGSMGQILEMMPIPGLKQAISGEQLAQGEGQLKKFETIIASMTPRERRSPKILDMSRKIRIAKGSGTRVEDVNKLLKDFENMNKVMKQFAGFQKSMPKHLQKALKKGQFPGMPGMTGSAGAGIPGLPFDLPKPGGGFPFKFK
ncbi:MAG: signal recognition particle protein [Candidatus Sericytochromatia bacterium]|nr:signal recognition particle protein [Candidatus Sericytochromatia bacterium]